MSKIFESVKNENWGKSPSLLKGTKATYVKSVTEMKNVLD